MKKQSTAISLQNIKIQLLNNIFNPQDRRYLRLSAQNIATTTKKPAKIINQRQLLWKQRLDIYTIKNKQQLSFQIFKKHQFGYNPDQLKSLLYGTIEINKAAKIHKVNVFNNLQQKIGSLSFQLKQKTPQQRNQFEKRIKKKLVQIQQSKSKSKIEKQQQMYQQKKILPKSSSVNNISMSRTLDNTSMYKSSFMNTQNSKDFGFVHINSIIVNVIDAIWIRAYILIKIGNKTIKTANIKSHLGQMAFIEGYKTSKNKKDEKAIFQLYSYQPKNNHTQLMGVSQVKLDQRKIVTKIPILNKDGTSIGQMHINLKQSVSKALMYNPSKIINPEGTFSSHDLIKAVQKSKSKINLSRIKKTSIVGLNNDIIFSKQRRFSNYQDTQSGIVSYLTQRERDLRFINTNNKYYKGAFVGYGTRADFTKQHENSPGVGRYQLPSIWDKY